MAYHVTYGQDAQSFWDTNAECLLEHESAYNLMIGLTLGILSADRAWGTLSFFTVFNGTKVVGQAMHTGGDKPLIITEMSQEAVTALVYASGEHGFSPVAVSGPAKTAKLCAEAFAKPAGARVQLTQCQGVYELKEVMWPEGDGGKLICGGPEQRELALEYTEAFICDCFPEEDAAGERAEEMVTRLLGAGHLFFWETPDGKHVSMAGRNREGPSTATISLVYTPPVYRGMGYARSVVACLSQIWLDRGKVACNLFTDLNNPTSNRVYESVGYVRLLESHIFQIEAS